MTHRAARTALVSIALLAASVVATGEASAGTGHPGAAAPTCLGAGVDPAARIRYRAETVIHAPLSTVWRLQTDVERWPAWQPPVSTIERLDDGPLRRGSQFRWTTPVPPSDLNPATTLVITSTVHQLKPKSCLRWSGPAIGEGLRIDNGVHVWNFIPVRGGVLVRTEETWTGAQVEADVAYSTTALGYGLDTWLRDLKAAAEAAHC